MLAELYPLVMKDFADIPEVHQGILRIAWNYCVGEKIRQVCKTTFYKDGVLHVKVTEPQWQSTLQFMQREIISKINKYLGKQTIQELKIEL
jgi:predicted nucleic acid-binding Zn ribbon protein